LHSNQAKRQRFKKLFRLELAKPPQSKSTKEIYCTPTKQNGKGLKAVSLGTGKATTHQANRANPQRVKKRSRCFVFDVD